MCEPFSSDFKTILRGSSFVGLRSIFGLRFVPTRLYRSANDLGTANDPTTGPEAIPASDTAEKENGVHSKKSLWMHIIYFFNLIS